jgi:hypothetical protein
MKDNQMTGYKTENIVMLQPVKHIPIECWEELDETSNRPRQGIIHNQGGKTYLVTKVNNGKN